MLVLSRSARCNSSNPVSLVQLARSLKVESADAVYAKIQRTIRELRIAMFCAGARTLSELRQIELVTRY